MHRMCLLLFLLTASYCMGQDRQRLRFTPADSAAFHKLIDLGQSGSIIATETRFGNDSSQWDVLWSDTSFLVTQSRSFKFSTDRVYLRDALVHDGHTLLCGTAESSNGLRSPLLLNLSVTTVDHSVIYSNLLFDQNELLGLHTINDSTYATYTTSSGFEPAFFRLNIPTDTFHADVVQITASSDINFRMITSSEANTPGYHWVGGTSLFNTDPDNKQALLTLTVPTGALWAKMYDLNNDSTAQLEEVRGLQQLSDGSLLVVMQYPDTLGRTRSAVMKVGPTGTPIWCTRLFLPQQDLSLETVLELDTGRLLVGGNKTWDDGIFVVLSDSGTVISQHVFFDGLDHQFNSIQRTALGTITASSERMILELREDLTGCEVFDYSDILAESALPDVTTVLLDNNPFVTLSGPLQADPTVTYIDLQEDCLLTSVPEATEGLEQFVLHAYPNPTTDLVWLNGAELDASSPIEVLTLQGSLIRRTAYGNGIDLAPLGPGAYLIQLPDERFKPVMVVKH